MRRIAARVDQGATATVAVLIRLWDGDPWPGGETMHARGACMYQGGPSYAGCMHTAASAALAGSVAVARLDWGPCT